MRLGAPFFPSFKVEVGQVEEHNAVCKVEQIIGLPAEMGFQLVLQSIQVGGDLVNVMVTGMPFLIAAHQFAYCRILIHDADGLQFGGCIYCPCDEIGQRRVDLYLVPALSFKESVNFKLTYCLQANPLGTNVTGIGMLDRVHVNKTFSLLPELFLGRLDGIDAAVFHHRSPELFCLAAYEFVVICKRASEQIPFALVLMKIVEAFTDISDVFRTVCLFDETHVQHDTTADAACKVAE